MKLAFAATMIRPRYFPDSIVAQLVSVSAFSHSLDPKATLAPLSEFGMTEIHRYVARRQRYGCR